MILLRRHLRKVVLCAGLAASCLGLAYGPNFLAPAPVQAAPGERHPHIRAAIHELRAARRELHEAAHDFGGHRVDAIAAIDNAISQLEVAVKFDRH